MTFDIKQFKKDLITKRQIDNDMTMDQAAAQIGISKATISRMEKGKLPDIETFGKVVEWLDEDVSKYFTIKKPISLKGNEIGQLKG